VVVVSRTCHRPNIYFDLFLPLLAAMQKLLATSRAVQSGKRTKPSMNRPTGHARGGTVEVQWEIVLLSSQWRNTSSSFSRSHWRLRPTQSLTLTVLISAKYSPMCE
jgi:hypothetical protein